MTANLITDVVLSEDGRDLTLSGPRTGTIGLHFESAEDAKALFDLFQNARERCVKAYTDERGDGEEATVQPGKTTTSILIEIVTLTEVAIEAADGVSSDDPRLSGLAGRKTTVKRAKRGRNDPRSRPRTAKPSSAE